MSPANGYKTPLSFPFESRELRAFLILVRCGSFTKAARELSLSQSAVSHCIKALETDAGCRLLDRMGKKVSLTLAGEQLLKYSERILADMDAARTAVAQFGKWGHARLRLAASATACQHILPRVFRQFKREFPKAFIHVETVDTPAAAELVRERRVDLALVFQTHAASDFHFERLFSDELAFVAAPDHPWIATGSGPVDIPRQNYILLRRGAATAQLIYDYFQQEKMELNVAIEVGSADGIKEMVKLGLGVGFLPPWMIGDEVRQKTLAALPLGPRKLRRTWGLIWRREQPLNMAQENFVKICRTSSDPATNALPPAHQNP